MLEVGLQAASGEKIGCFIGRKCVHDRGEALRRNEQRGQRGVGRYTHQHPRIAEGGDLRFAYLFKYAGHRFC
ncbi:hypothetical protein D3C80_1573070 [compost metagenome]